MLKPFFEPTSVAVIGASVDPAKLGHAVLKNLVESGYPRRGKVYPINPKTREILGHPAYPSVLDVPGPIELAVIVIPYQYVPAALRTCGQKGIRAVIVISAGFREAGVEGLQRERELLAIAREFNIRLIGPNCVGVIDTLLEDRASWRPMPWNDLVCHWRASNLRRSRHWNSTCPIPSAWPIRWCARRRHAGSIPSR